VVVGDVAFGGRVVGIAPGSVSLEYGGERLTLKLMEAASTPRAFGPPPLSVPDERSVDRATHWTMTRGDLDRRLADEVPRILAETTLVPVTDGGQIAGFAVTRLPEGGLLSDAGLRAGDILTRINDVPIDSLATLIGLWPRLKTESELNAVVLRNGQPVSLKLTLK